MAAFPDQTRELIKLNEEDQAEKRAIGRAYFNDDEKLKQKLSILRLNTKRRTKRMLEILDEISAPSLSNIGAEAAQAVSVLALHDSLSVQRRVLEIFQKLYDKDKENVYYQAIPSMVDSVLILERKAQKFGTQWQFDKDRQPFLPTVEDFEHVNDRRAEYGIGPLRWPKSLAIAESEQPWLKRPFTELVVRDITDDDFAKNYQDYVD